MVDSMFVDFILFNQGVLSYLWIKYSNFLTSPVSDAVNILCVRPDNPWINICTTWMPAINSKMITVITDIVDIIKV